MTRRRLASAVFGFGVMVFILAMFAGIWVLSLRFTHPLVGSEPGVLIGYEPLILVTGFASLGIAYAVYSLCSRLLGLSDMTPNPEGTP